MRSRLKAGLLSERLEGREPSQLIKLDPELREMDLISSLLEEVPRSQPMPAPESRERMRARVMECHRRIMEGEKTRERDPSGRVSTLEPQRLSYAALAAAALVAVILVVSSVVLTFPRKVMVTPPMPMAEAEALVFATGEVEVLTPGGEWAEERAPFRLREGSYLRTPAEVRAEVAFGGETLFRLDGGSEAGLSEVGEEAVAVELRAGEGYFRVEEGIAFRVYGGGLEAEALGTVFDFDIGGERPELLALQDGVEVRTYPPGEEDEAVRLDEGRMLVPPPEPGEEGLEGGAGDIPPERLLEEWLAWNRNIDELRGWDVGVLSRAEPGEPAVPEISRLEAPEEQGDDEGEDGGGEDEPDKPEVSLQASLEENGAALSWELKQGSAGEFIVLRAEGREPVFPRDVLARLTPDTFKFLDRQVREGGAYTYRVAVEHDDQTVYSNSVIVRVPARPPTIQLSARLVDGGLGIPVVELSWRAEGGMDPQLFSLVRGEMNRYPAYPPGSDMVEYRFNPAGPEYVFYDEAVYTGYTYNYRVYAVRDGRVLVESNAVSIYVDTAAIMAPVGPPRD